MNEIKRSSSRANFNFIDEKDLTQALQPPVEMNRLKSKDTARSNSLPTSITDGARFRGVSEIEYYVDSTAVHVFDTIPLGGLLTVPLADVWLLGSRAVGSGGGIVEGGGRLPGNYAASTDMTNGMQVFEGAIAAYSVTKDSLIIGVTPSDNAYAPIYRVVSYFYYAVYYDDTEVAEYGL